MLNIAPPPAKSFPKMTQEMARMLIIELHIQESCPLALALDDEHSRTNMECLCRWLRLQAEQDRLEPKLENKAELASRLDKRLSDLFDSPFYW